VLKAATGKARQVHVLLWIVAVVFAIYFAIEPLKTLFGIH
jgi:AGZA family xanthine/uracil permease-like MFS transporter